MCAGWCGIIGIDCRTELAGFRIQNYFMADQKTIAVYDSQVDNYVETINKAPVDEMLLDFISQFKPDDLILDLGCGPAMSSAAMREHGLRTDPVDASIEMVRLANETYNIGARQAYFEEIASRQIYNGIWANFSLLHATREELPNILNRLHQSLKPNGIFQLRMKTGEGSQRDKFDRYYSYYSEEELCGLLSEAGFSVKQTETGEALGLAGDMEPWIALKSFA